LFRWNKTLPREKIEEEEHQEYRKTDEYGPGTCLSGSESPDKKRKYQNSLQGIEDTAKHRHNGIPVGLCKHEKYKRNDEPPGVYLPQASDHSFSARIDERFNQQPRREQRGMLDM